MANLEISSSKGEVGVVGRVAKEKIGPFHTICLEAAFDARIAKMHLYQVVFSRFFSNKSK